jgi:hypothetical protein
MLLLEKLLLSTLNSNISADFSTFASPKAQKLVQRHTKEALHELDKRPSIVTSWHKQFARRSVAKARLKRSENSGKVTLLFTDQFHTRTSSDNPHFRYRGDPFCVLDSTTNTLPGIIAGMHGLLDENTSSKTALHRGNLPSAIQRGTTEMCRYRGPDYLGDPWWAWLRSYVTPRFKHDDVDLLKLLRTLAPYCGERLVISRISEALGETPTKIETYFKRLEEIGLLISIPKFTNTENESSASQKLGVLFDSGLLSFLTDRHNPPELDGEDRRPFWRTVVAADIIRSIGIYAPASQLYYWQQRNRWLLVIKSGNTLFPVSIDQGLMPSKKSIRDINYFRKHHKAKWHIGSAFMLHKGVSAEQTGNNDWSLPFDAYINSSLPADDRETS